MELCSALYKLLMADTSDLPDSGSESIVASPAASLNTRQGDGSVTPRQPGSGKLNLCGDMSVEELVAWLEHCGIPSKFLRVFEGEQIFSN